MLKTSTETGDASLFARPSRMPHHQVGMIPGHLASGYSTRGSPPRRYYANGQSRTLPANYRDRNGSNGRAIHHANWSPPRRVYEPSPERFSTKPARPTERMLSAQRSYSSLQSRRGPLVASRPRSPYAYPVQRRGDVRSNSPSKSESGAAEYSTRPPVSRGPSFRAHSPSSLYVQKRYGVVHRQDQNGSLRPSNSVASSNLGQNQNRRPSPQRATTPRTQPDQASFLGASRNQLMPPMPDYLPSRSRSPLYYDYTEAFEDQVYYSANTSMSSMPRYDTPRTLSEKRFFGVPSDHGPRGPAGSSLRETSRGYKQTGRGVEAFVVDLDKENQRRVPTSWPERVDSRANLANVRTGDTHMFGESSAQHSQLGEVGSASSARPAAETVCDSNGGEELIEADVGQEQRVPFTVSPPLLCESPQDLVVPKSRMVLSQDDSDESAMPDSNNTSSDFSTVDTSRPVGETSPKSTCVSRLKIHAPTPERPVSSKHYGAIFHSIVSVEPSFVEVEEPNMATGTSLIHPKGHDVDGGWNTNTKKSAVKAPLEDLGRSQLMTTSGNDALVLQGARSPLAKFDVVITNENDSSNGTKRGADSPPQQRRSISRSCSPTAEIDTARLLKLKASFPWLTGELPAFLEDPARSHPPLNAAAPIQAAPSLAPVAQEPGSVLFKDRTVKDGADGADKMGKDAAAMAVVIRPKFKLKLRQ